MSYCRFIWISVFLVLSCSLRGQIGSARSKLTLIFKEEQTLQITHPQVDIHLSGGGVFQKGAESGRLNNHLVVRCSSPYEVTVRTLDSYFQHEDGPSLLPVSMVRIWPYVKNTGITDHTLRGFTISLSTSAQVLLQSNAYNNSHFVDVNYYIPPEDISKVINQKAGVYQTVLVYTLIAH